MKLAFLAFLVVAFVLFSMGSCKNVTSRPSVVNIGAILAFNSTIGGVSTVAIRAALDDINADPTILNGTTLAVEMQDTNCDDGFLGMVEALQFMETDVVAIIGPQCSTIAHIISYVANELQVPLMSFATDTTLSSLQFPFFVRTAPSDLFEMSAVAAIVDYYQWKLVTAIYIDDEYGRNGIAVLDDKLAERRCKIAYKATFAPSAKKGDIIDLLVQVSNMESRVIVVHASKPGLIVLELANQLQMMGNGYVWIATDWLSSYLDSNSSVSSKTMSAMQGVLTLRPHIANSKMKSALVSKWGTLTKKYGHRDLRLNSFGFYVYDSVWTVARALDSLFSSGQRISFSNDSRLRFEKSGGLHLEAMSVFDQGRLLLDYIRKANFTGVSGQVQFDAVGDLIHPSYDIINVVGTGLRTVGYWSNYSGLSITPPETLYSKPPNNSVAGQRLYDVIWPGETAQRPRGWVFPYNAKELRIGVPYRHSFQQFVTKDNTTGTMKGYCIDVFTQALALLPYPVSYRFVPFGNGNANPNYDELVQKVASNEFDAAVGDIAITMNRTQIVDFTQPFIESGLVILSSIRKRSSNAWAFLQPFTVEMWCVTGCFFLVVGAVVWVLEHRINSEFRGPPRQQVVTIFWFSFSTLFFAHRENTVSTLGRAVVIIWLFVVLIIQSSYTASLTSILTVQQLASSIQGIGDLKNSNDPIGFQVGSFAEEYMVRELNISHSRLKALGSPEEYARALTRGPNHGGVSAIVDERPYVDLFLSTECRIAVAGSDFTSRGWGFAFPRDSPLQVDLSTAILALSENGELQRIHDKWLMTSDCNTDTSEFVDSNRLRLESFWGLFLICGAACVLALLVYLYRTVRQYMRHVPRDEAGPSIRGSSSPGRSLRSFLSFVDEKEESFKSRTMRRQDQKPSKTGTVDIEER